MTIALIEEYSRQRRCGCVLRVFSCARIVKNARDMIPLGQDKACNKAMARGWCLRDPGSTPHEEEDGVARGDINVSGRIT